MTDLYDVAPGQVPSEYVEEMNACPSCGGPTTATYCWACIKEFEGQRELTAALEAEALEYFANPPEGDAAHFDRFIAGDR